MMAQVFRNVLIAHLDLKKTFIDKLMENPDTPLEEVFKMQQLE